MGWQEQSLARRMGPFRKKGGGGAVKEKLKGKFRMSISAAHTRQVCWCAGWTATPSQLPFPDLIPPNLMSFGLSHLSTLCTLFRFPILASNIPCVPLYCTAHGSDISGTRLVCCGCISAWPSAIKIHVYERTTGKDN